MPIQVKEAVGVLLRLAQTTPGMPCGAFGSYGWSGEAPGEINMRLLDAGFKAAFEPIAVKMKPKPKDLSVCKEAGTRLAQRIQEGKQAARAAKLKRQQEAAEKRAQVQGSTETADTAEKAFGRIVNSSCLLTFKLGEQEDLIRMPVSWVSQASFDPPGIMVAVQQEEMDNLLFDSVDDQITALFTKYDADGSGVLDKEESMLMLDELFGLEAGEAEGAGFAAKKEEAWLQLDQDGSGEVDTQEFREQAENESGVLARLIAQQRRLTSMETLVGSENKLNFTLSILPTGMSRAEAMEAGLAKKAKVANGCSVIDGAVSFLECQAVQAIPTGTCMLMYSQVTAGKVLDEGKKSEMLDEEGRVVAASEESSGAEGPQPEVAMSAVGTIHAATVNLGGPRSCLAGASLGQRVR